MLVHCWWECKLTQSIQKTVWRFLKKLKLKLSHDSAIPVLGIYPKEMKSLPQRDIYTPMFTETLLTIARTWEKPKYYSALKKEENPAICDNIDGL